MSSHYKVHELLNRDELDQLELYAREPGRTVDEIHEWMQVRGYTLSRTAAWTWKRAFDEQLLKERFSRSGELAKAIKSAVAGEQMEDVAEAAVMQLTQVVFEQSAKLESEGQLDPLDVQRMTKSLANLVASKMGLVRIYAQRFEKEMADTGKAAAGKRPEEVFTPERIAEARRRIFGC